MIVTKNKVIDETQTKGVFLKSKRIIKTTNGIEAKKTGRKAIKLIVA